MLVRELEGEAPTEQVYERLFAAAENSFWLDSADAPTWLAQCSYLGTSAGADRCLFEYDVDSGEVAVQRGGVETVEHRSIFDLLDRELARNAIEPPSEVGRGLVGGYVGYLGYELKADCGSPNVHSSDLPDAAMMLANRVVAVDHSSGRTLIFALAREGDEEAERWLEVAESLVAELIDSPPPERPLAPAPEPDGEVSFSLGRGREQYLADIGRCQAELAAGESYEICLTDQISTDASPDPFDLYRQLRRSNPAPFAAFLRFGERAIVSSSPERFLSVDRDRTVQARPIKGTISRSEDPVEDEARRRELGEDEKTGAEHLMIVDLLRNDLGRVCEVDSVSVPDLMVVEPYATVHQVVSTITGTLEQGRTAAECVRNCFPGGSMTGAPKERTMEIIDDIEERGARRLLGGDRLLRPRRRHRSQHRHPHDRDAARADDDRRRRRDRDAVRPGRRVRRDPAQGAGADGGDRPHRHRPRGRGGLERGAGAGGAQRGGGVIRTAGEDDVVGIADAVEELLVELGGSRPARGEVEAEVRAIVGDPRAGLLLVAERDGRLAGVLGASWQRAIHVPGRYATIQDLWVDSAHRSNGIGAELVAELVRLAAEQGVARIEVGLPKESFAAIDATEAFYRDNGFEHLGPRMRRLLP